MAKLRDALSFTLWTMKNAFHYGFIPAVIYLGKYRNYNRLELQFYTAMAITRGFNPARKKYDPTPSFTSTCRIIFFLAGASPCGR